MSKFFIDRPIFSSVISLVIVLTGIATYLVLPVEQFPDIVPPTVSVMTNYPGASSKVLAETVAVPIEDKINGVDNMIYFASASDNNGNLNMTVTFDIGTDPDMATVNVNNRVQQALPTLPESVKRQGVIVQKQSTNILLVLAIYDPLSEDDPNAGRGDLYLSNYASIKLKDVLARVPGVGQAKVLDAKDYGMRLWLNPNLMAERGISPRDVIRIVQEQNVQVAAGKIGQPPVPQGQEIEYTVTTLGRLETVEQFENLVVRTGENGEILKLKDIARIELGSQTYGHSSKLNGIPAATIGIYQLPGANAVAVVKKLRTTLEELEPMFGRDGIRYEICYDATEFIEASIEEVQITLLIAGTLVLIVVFVFLHDWRAVLIPTLAIPVSLLGATALMALFGFSINTLSLFGIILAIGIVVDDAILVVENTQRLIDTENLSPQQAAHRAMQQITGPIIATTLVLMAVFIPTGLMPGIVGKLYAQFALTIAGATAVSSVFALSLAPALCAILLRKSSKKKFVLFRKFNVMFASVTRGYLGGVSRLLRVAFLVLLLWAGVIIALSVGSKMLPTGFLPNEDQGVVFLEVRLPDGASFERTERLTSQLQPRLQEIEEIENVLFINGFSMVDNIESPNVGLAFLPLKPWKDRANPAQQAQGIIEKITALTMQFPQARITVFGPPPIMGLGSSGGVQMQLLDQGNAGDTRLYEAMNRILEKSQQSETLLFSSSSFRPTTPMFYLDIDRDKVQKLHVSLDEVFTALQAYFGSYYINDFNRFDRVFRVMGMADMQYRTFKEDLANIKVRNKDGDMLPISTFLIVQDEVGPEVVYRYNMYPSTMIASQLQRGKSTGQGMAELDSMVEELGSDFGYEWTNMSYQEAKVGNATVVIFTLAIMFAFLVLAAQYESWSAPLIILMAIPLAICGALLGVAVRGLDVNVYTQIGLVILIGLSAKNSILIVEFAREARKTGKSVYDSAMEASRLRLRPILMTSFASILGVVPLVLATGAGAASRQAIGTAVFFGMLAVTGFGIFVTPTLYLLVQNLSEKCGRGLAQFLGRDKDATQIHTAPDEKLKQ